jgi:2Fe-2S ferredoxin
MPIIRFIQPDGSEAVASANVGESVMQSAVNHQVPGILGDCGGSCSCATCHAYVDEAWVGHMPAAAPYEIDMLTCAIDVRKNSRLTCQINVTPELDGLVVRLPSTA